MTSFWWNLLEVNMTMVLLWIVFRMVRNQLSFGQQRLSLLAIPVLSVATLLMKTGLSGGSLNVVFPVVELDPIIVKSGNAATSLQDQFWSLESIYWIIASLFACWMILRIVRTISLFLSNQRHSANGFSWMEIPNKDSFSFFRWIQIRSGLSAEDREIVLQHELIHARKGHTLDVLYLELVHCFCWFNPFLPFIKKDLIHVHEFEVDQLMYNKYNVHYMQFLLSYSLGTSSSSYLLTNQFLTKLTLIKRINIMKHTAKKRWVLVLALPLFAGALTLVSWTSQQEEGPRKTRNASVPVMDEVEKPAEFKGGMDALVTYMSTNMKYPESAAKNKISGKVMTSFVITETGKVTDVKIMRGVNADMDAEAKRVVEAMPDWIPAEKGGKKVKSEMILPVSFQL
ncbi:MAG: M56 family metallopeptidase [Bacteroidota bacterium]